MNVVSLSGGKDSTAMLLMMIEKNIKIDKIIFVDTTKEFPAMYKHIKKIKKICPVEITTIEIDFDYWFGERIKTRGKIGEIGYGWPHYLGRWCTGLKIQAKLKNKDKNDIDFIGIAYDEKHRVMKNTSREIFRYPLVEWGITSAQALQYCYSKGFDWDGLYEKFNRVSCYCCPLSRISELRILYNDFPELWKELEEMDKKTFRNFRKDYTLKELKEKFDKENLNIPYKKT